MEFNKKNMRLLSLLGHRGTFSKAVCDLAESGEDICVLTADLADLTGLEHFYTDYPDRFFNIGIAEQNMIGIAAGLSRYGSCVFATTYANFLTMRPYEQIRMNLGYMQHNVKLIGTGAGLSMGMSGNSHFGLEDISLMCSIPNMTVISPADCTEAYKCISAAAKTSGPMYIRLSGPLNQPMVYKEDYDFKIGQAVTLKEGSDIIIISTGSVAFECLKAAELLENNHSLSTAVINMHTLKPIDENIIQSYANRGKLIVTVEEHSVIGGLGSITANILSSYSAHTPLYKIGLPDSFGVSGSANFLAEYYGLKAPLIAESILSRLEDYSVKRS